MTEHSEKRSPGTALAYAFAASFLVYCAPLLFPHVLTIWGLALLAEFVEGFAGREPLWMAADLGLAALSQFAMGAFFYWVFRRRARLRAMGLAVVFPALAAAVLVLYTIIIPAHFLIEAETRAETGDWPVACAIDDASLAAVKPGVTLALERAGEAWIHRGGGSGLALLRMPGCAVAPIAPAGDARLGSLRQALPGGVGLYLVLDRPGGRYRLVRGLPDGGKALDLDLTTDETYSAILSADGGWVFWLRRLRGERGATLGYEIHGRNLATDERTRFRLPAAKPAGIELLSADPASSRYILARNGKTVIGIDGKGATVWGPVASPGFHVGPNNWRRLDGGWVAWEGYRDRGRYRVAWSLAGGDGVHEVPKGRNIKDVSVSPSGGLIAVSVGSALNLGDVRDAVYVLRAADGAEIFRRYLKRHSRSQVAFLGDAHFAFTRYKEDGKRRRGRVVVLRVPEAP